MAPQFKLLVKAAEERVEEVIRNLRRLKLWTCLLSVTLLLTVVFIEKGKNL
jgi:hypothetical protein